MLNKLLIGAGLALCVAACASKPSAPGAATSRLAPQSNVLPAGCVADTGTRIPVGPRECAGFGHTWGQQDMRSTGAVDAGQALRLLDPTVTVHQ